MALGSIPPVLLSGWVDVVINALIRCTIITPSSEKWVDSRRHAVKALTAVCSSVGISDPDIKKSCQAHVLDILLCFTEGLTDYTKDDRGDTGAWVREACMSGLQTLLQLVSKEAPELLTEEVVRITMCRISQQAVERIDRTRALAGTVFSTLLHNVPEIPYIPERAAVLEIFPENACKNEINWLSHADTFPKFTQMLDLTSYTESILLGLIASVGGLTESLVKTSSQCLFDYLAVKSTLELSRIATLIVNIYEAHIKIDRILLPMLNFLEKLLSSGSIKPILDDPNSDFAKNIFNLTKTAVMGSLDKNKLLGSVNVYCQLIQVRGEVCRRALGRVLILLCHRFGWLRKATATKLYEALMLYGEDEEEFCSADKLDSAMSILSETEWSIIPIEEARPIRNKLCEIFGLPIPTIVPIAKS
ncbi:hypothetical protein O3M35_010231 [Rhynocoris fuscipes]